MDEVTGTPEQEAQANPATETDDVDVISEIVSEETASVETPTEETPQPRKLKVKIDGQELEVDEEEAAKGYQRQADYSRHMQKLQAESQQIAQMRNMYQQRIEQFIPEQEARLQRLNQELQQLAIDDPASWVAKKQEFDTELIRYQQATTERQQLANQSQQEYAQRLAQSQDWANQVISEAIPEWKNPEVKAKQQGEVTKFIVDNVQKMYGENAPRVLQEIDSGMYGPMPIILARKAMLYDQMMQKVAARKAGQSEMTQAPEPVTPIRTSSGGQKDPSKMSDAEWIKSREKQVRSRS